MSSLEVYSYTFIIILIILVLGFVSKRLISLTSYGKALELIHVLALKSITPKKSIALVEIAGTVYVLGLSEAGISIISSMDSGKVNSKLEKISPKDQRQGLVKWINTVRNIDPSS